MNIWHAITFSLWAATAVLMAYGRSDWHVPPPIVLVERPYHQSVRVATRDLDGWQVEIGFRWRVAAEAEHTFRARYRDQKQFEDTVLRESVSNKLKDVFEDIKKLKTTDIDKTLEKILTRVRRDLPAVVLSDVRWEVMRLKSPEMKDLEMLIDDKRNAALGEEGAPPAVAAKPIRKKKNTAPRRREVAKTRSRQQVKSTRRPSSPTWFNW